MLFVPLLVDVDPLFFSSVVENVLVGLLKLVQVLLEEVNCDDGKNGRRLLFVEMDVVPFRAIRSKAAADCITK